MGNNTSFLIGITGKAMPATIYLLVYTAWTLAISSDWGVNFIRITYSVFYAMTMWYFFKSISFLGSSKFMLYLSLLLVLFVIYGIYLYVNGVAGWKREIDPISFLTYYLPSVLPVFVFYYFGRRGIIQEHWFKVFFVLFFLNVVMLYFKEQRDLLQHSMTGDSDFISNTGYLIASLLPLISFFDKRKVIQYIFAVIIILFTLICYKRGAILCVGLSFVYFIYKTIKESRSINKIMVLFIVLFLFYYLYLYIGYLLQTNDFFYYRAAETMEGNTSGRDSIYAFFLKYFFSAENGSNILWGNGAEGTVKIYGLLAHNDWLEFAIDFGIIGFVIYLFYWIRVFKNIRFAKKQLSSVFYCAIVMCIIINFSRTFISMSIGNMSFVTASILGTVMGIIDMKREILYRNKKNSK